MIATASYRPTSAVEAVASAGCGIDDRGTDKTFLAIGARPGAIMKLYGQSSRRSALYIYHDPIRTVPSQCAEVHLMRYRGSRLATFNTAVMSDHERPPRTHIRISPPRKFDDSDPHIASAVATIPRPRAIYCLLALSYIQIHPPKLNVVRAPFSRRRPSTLGNIKIDEGDSRIAIRSVLRPHRATPNSSRLGDPHFVDVGRPPLRRRRRANLTSRPFLIDKAFQATPLERLFGFSSAYMRRQRCPSRRRVIEVDCCVAKAVDCIVKSSTTPLGVERSAAEAVSCALRVERALSILGPE
ncbi:hypothetical protein EV714DRAFT_277835 [Schizophyllum commune]